MIRYTYHIELWCQGCRAESPGTWTTDPTLVPELAKQVLQRAINDKWVEDPAGYHFCPKCQVDAPEFEPFQAGQEIA